MRVKTGVRLASAGLIGTAVAQELRKPPEDRTWTGTVGGLVPYDFRRPTPQRVKAALWAPDDPHVVRPQVFGVGWSLNLGRLARLARGDANAG